MVGIEWEKKTKLKSPWRVFVFADRDEQTFEYNRNKL